MLSRRAPYVPYSHPRVAAEHLLRTVGRSYNEVNTLVSSSAVSGWRWA